MKPLNSLLRITSRSSYAHPSTTFATFEEYLESQTQFDGQPSTSGSASELELRGRIHILMSGLFKLSDQSATNSRGAYADMLSGYDETPDGSSKPLEGDVKSTEDSDMEVSNGVESSQSHGESSHVRFAGLRDSSAVWSFRRTVRRRLRPTAVLQHPIRYRHAVIRRGRTNRTAGIETRHGNRLIRLCKVSSAPVAGFLISATALYASICSEQRHFRVSGKPDISETLMRRLSDHHGGQLGELEFRRQLCIQLLIILQQIQNLHVKDKSRHPKDPHFPATFSVETADVSDAASRKLFWLMSRLNSV